MRAGRSDGDVFGSTADYQSAGQARKEVQLNVRFAEIPRELRRGAGKGGPFAFVAGGVASLAREPRKANPDNEDNPPSPSEVFAIALDWIRHYWEAPREKSKWTEVAMVILTLLTVIAAFVSAWIFQAQLTAARTAAEAQERPWVSAKISLVRPLSFTKDRASLGVAAVLKNEGHSPALSVRFVSKVISLNRSDDLWKRQSEYCEFWKHRSSMAGLPGNTIFPGDEYPYSETTGMDPDELRAGLEKTSIPGEISPWLIACVDYQFYFASEHHQTLYAYPLGKPLPAGGWMGYFAPAGTPDGIVLIPSMMGESAY